MKIQIAFRAAIAAVLFCASSFAAIPSKLNRVVLAYSASYRDDVTPVDLVNFKGVTYLARAFLHPNPDGTIDTSPTYFDPKLTRLAHAHGVKLLMSIGGEADDSTNWMSVATHPDLLKKHLGALVKMAADNHYDGVDIDWEPAPVSKPEAAAYGAYLHALRKVFPTGVITTALPASDYWIGNVNWADVLGSVDYVNVMVYDYAGGWGGIAGHGSNLFPPGDFSPTPGYSADEGMQNLLVHHHLPPGKLLMGLTFWGYRFRADTIGNAFPKNAPGYSDSVTYGQTMDLLGTGRYLSLWDEAAKMPYLRRLGGGAVICYENAESIRRKCEYAAANHCGGVMIWHAAADVAGRQAVLMDAVVQSSGGPAYTLPESAMKVQIDALSNELDHQPAIATTGDQADATLAALRARWGLAEDKRWSEAKPAGK